MGWYGVITNAGKAALEQSLVYEQVLDIDAVKLGTGTYSTAQLYTATSVKNQCGTGAIGSKRALSTGVQIIANIYALPTAKTVKQIGIFGTINSVSVLLAIYQNDRGIDVPSTTQFPDYAYALSAVWDIDNIENLTISVDQTSCVPYTVYNAQVAEYDVAIGNKVDKVQGKGLSTEDFTTAYKDKLDGIQAQANKYTLPAATALTLGGVKVGDNLAIDANGVLSASFPTGAPDYTGFFVGDGTGSAEPYRRKIDLPFSPMRVVIIPMKWKNQTASDTPIITFGYAQNYVHSGCPNIDTWITTTDVESYFTERKHGGATIATNGFYVGYASSGCVDINVTNQPYLFFAWETDPFPSQQA